MKKLLLSLICCTAIFNFSNAQCSITSAPTNNCTYGDMIQAYILNSIPASGNSGCGLNGYNSFSSPIWTLQVGGNYSWSSTVGSGYYDEGFAIWIDLNNDGNYAPSEMLASSAPALSHSGSIFIPYTAALGTNLRMRIRCAYYSTIAGTDACINNIGYGYGETEDYYVYLVCPATTPSITVAATSTFICLGSAVTLSASGAASYTWTGGVTNGSPFSPGATTSYTVNSSFGSSCPSNTNSAAITVSVQTTPLPINAVAFPSVGCVGGSNTLSATGANSYTWFPGGQTGANISVSATAPSVYTVVGANNIGGCPGGTTVSLNVIPSPTVTASVSSSMICQGASATITASGASTYSWTNINQTGSVVVVTPTIPTAYQVIGYNSSGCSGSTSQIIITAASPVLNLSTSNSEICNGDQVTLSVNGANSYLWDFGANTATAVITPTASTTYSVVGTNTAGCSSTGTVYVSVLTPTISITSPTAVCSGATTSLIVNGASTYIWSNGSQFNPLIINPTTSGSYSVSTLSNMNSLTCPGSASVMVLVNPNPTVTAAVSRPNICKDESTTVTATGASSYSWSNGASGVSATVTSSLITTINLVVTGTSSLGCSSTASASIKINACTGIDNAGSGNIKLLLFPNPNTGEFTVSYSAPLRLELVNELGQVIKHIELNASNNYSQKITGLSEGVYFIGSTENGQSTQQKIIVSR